MEEVADITLRWARSSVQSFPKWEIDELHNEAFIIAMKLLTNDKYDKDKGALSTFLWNALPRDVRHRYRRMNGERYVTSKEDGVRRYRQVEVVDNTPSENAVVNDPCITILDVSNNARSQWFLARSSGYTASELRRRGMSYKEQRREAEELRDTRHDDKQ
jgi:hypothetical protein